MSLRLSSGKGSLLEGLKSRFVVGIRGEASNRNRAQRFEPLSKVHDWMSRTSAGLPKNFGSLSILTYLLMFLLGFMRCSDSVVVRLPGVEGLPV